MKERQPKHYAPVAGKPPTDAELWRTSKKAGGKGCYVVYGAEKNPITGLHEAEVFKMLDAQGRMQLMTKCTAPNQWSAAKMAESPFSSIVERMGEAGEPNGRDSVMYVIAPKKETLETVIFSQVEVTRFMQAIARSFGVKPAPSPMSGVKRPSRTRSDKRPTKRSTSLLPVSFVSVSKTPVVAPVVVPVVAPVVAASAPATPAVTVLVASKPKLPFRQSDNFSLPRFTNVAKDDLKQPAVANFFERRRKPSSGQKQQQAGADSSNSRQSVQSVQSVLAPGKDSQLAIVPGLPTAPEPVFEMSKLIPNALGKMVRRPLTISEVFLLSGGSGEVIMLRPSLILATKKLFAAPVDGVEVSVAFTRAACSILNGRALSVAEHKFFKCVHNSTLVNRNSALNANLRQFLVEQGSALSALSTPIDILSKLRVQHIKDFFGRRSTIIVATVEMFQTTIWRLLSILDGTKLSQSQMRYVNRIRFQCIRRAGSGLESEAVPTDYHLFQLQSVEFKAAVAALLTPTDAPIAHPNLKAASIQQLQARLAELQ